MSAFEDALKFFDEADKKLGKVYDPPDGFLTIQRVAKAKGWTHSKAHQKLQAMAKHGLAEERDHRVRKGMTKVYRILP